MTWAQIEPGVRAAAIIGSQARIDHPADQWSDLDILVFVNDVEPYVTDGTWAEQIAPVWLNFTERTPDGSAWERRVLFAASSWMWILHSILLYGSRPLWNRASRPTWLM